MSARSFLLGAVVLVLLAVLAGLLIVGSPFEARRQTLDEHRYRELAALAAAFVCPPEKMTPVLPVELTVENLRTYCGGRNFQPPALVDDETNEPYKYARKSEDEYAICAKFYDAGRTARLTQTYPYPRTGWAFDPATGCVTGRIR